MNKRRVEKIKKNRRKKRLIIAIVVFLFLSLVSFVTLIATRPLPKISDETIKIINKNKTESVSFAFPEKGSSAIGTLESGLKTTAGTLEQRPTASLAKVITALVVLEEKPITNENNPLITMSANDVQRYHDTVALGGSFLYINEGEQLTERQMIEALMLPSANNIADSLVEWAFGGQDNYRAAAEQWLAEHDLSQTTIGSDASGFDPSTTASVTDMFEIARLALQNPTLSEIMREESAIFPSAGEITNTNSLLRDHSGYIGLKTGTSEQADACLMFASEQNIGDEKTTIVGVIMGIDYGTTFNAARALTESAKNNLTEYTIYAGQRIVNYKIPWGMSVDATTSDKISGVTWKDEDPRIVVDLGAVNQQSRSGDQIGTLRFNNKQVNLELAQDIQSPDLIWRMTHITELDWSIFKPQNTIKE